MAFRNGEEDNPDEDRDTVKILYPGNGVLIEADIGIEV